MRFRSTLAGLAVVSVAGTAAAPARASDVRWATTLEGDATWFAHVPSMQLRSSSTTAFDAMQGATLDGGESALFPGLTLDGRLMPRHSTWFVPLLGLHFGIAQFDRDLSFDGGIAAHVGNLLYGELLFPGIGARLFGDVLWLSARPIWARIETEGSATDGHLTIGIGGASGGVGVVGDVAACIPGTVLCAFAQTAALYMADPDYAVSVGVRLGYVPGR